MTLANMHDSDGLQFKERKEGRNEGKGLCPRNAQMDADEAGFFRKAHPRLI
jgi:hypothetical protein